MDAVVLMDPVIQRGGGGSNWAAASTYRRDLWPSRKVAAEKLRSSPALKLWDPRVLDKFIEYGLRELPTEQYPEIPPESKESGDIPVTLQTTKAQEVYNYIQPMYYDERLMVPEHERHRDFSSDDLAFSADAAFNRSEKIALHRRLPEIRPSTLFVFGATSEVSGPEARKDKLDITGTGPGGSGGAKKGMVKEVVIQSGHLVPLEKPDDSGVACAEFVDGELGRWEREEKERWRIREKFTREERVGINELWKKNIGGPPGRRKKEEPGGTKL
jgi:pimeloyl-ACP methyl ester carboxylesterase